MKEKGGSDFPVLRGATEPEDGFKSSQTKTCQVAQHHHHAVEFYRDGIVFQSVGRCCNQHMPHLCGLNYSGR